MEEKINEILTRIHPGYRYMTEERIFSDRILDSLEFTMLVAELEDNFKVTIDFDDLMPEKFDSIRLICQLLNK